MDLAIGQPDALPPPGFRPYTIPPPRYLDRPGPYPNQSSSSSSREVSGPAPKVPIPRTTSFGSQSQRRRSARACDPCRQRKIKCDGSKPHCRQCIDHNISCIYVDVKRVRDQKQLGFLCRRVESYEQLLHELEKQEDEETARRIRRALRGSADHAPDAEDDIDSDTSSSSIGSLNALDLIEEDLNRSERSVATGFFGKNSEVSWMQKLEDEAEIRSRAKEGPLYSDSLTGGDLQQPRPETAIATMTYFVDDLNVPLIDSVDPYALPPKDVANRLFNAYMESVHPSFNIIRKTTFVSQFRQFYNTPAKPPMRWLAVLNMIFAIGRRYCRVVTGEADGDHEDLVYLNRARKLALGDAEVFAHADLQQIQVEFLVAFYFVTMYQVNRAFKFSSMAFRSAVSLGINLRFVDDRTQYPAKEARGRLWWSIFLLEHLLTAVTGRASCVGESLSSTPLPIPFDEDKFGRPDVLPLLQDSSLRSSRLKLTLLQTEEEARATAAWLATCEPSSSLFFHCTVDLAIITQAVLYKIYSIQGLRDRASQVEQRIHRYNDILDIWVSKVPEPYRFITGTNDQFDASDRDSNYTREQLSLAINYYSARITLCRPCLSHAGATKPSSLSPDGGTSSSRRNSRSTSHPRSQFRYEMAIICIRSACNLLAVLPDTPDILWLSSVTPWWCILHYIMQATTAILIHLSSWPPGPARRSRSISHEDSTQCVFTDMSTLVRKTKKALHWLNHMAVSHTASRRAFRLCHSVVRRLAPSLNIDISDLPDGSDLPADAEGTDLGLGQALNLSDYDSPIQS
ncbi:C6 transcription factor [Aspergillus heteromorphus CBS 117.55]|uniref:C6 transcription factor n=1 Tax=Aspergillus heteromorphus CBS 117.55 TaxID=1448321 RepID=A0A317VRY4_9EURO|nr:C6 transcription factor [Aspergillus heteromorphus CBS 117.55]PWY77083.1 C6 transcription factor [Aspergillus heteromorphus CBS 117.55]